MDVAKKNQKLQPKAKERKNKMKVDRGYIGSDADGFTSALCLFGWINPCARTSSSIHANELVLIDGPMFAGMDSNF
jgi:hypothetical protein